MQRDFLQGRVILSLQNVTSAKIKALSSDYKNYIAQLREFRINKFIEHYNRHPTDVYLNYITRLLDCSTQSLAGGYQWWLPQREPEWWIEKEKVYIVDFFAKTGYKFNIIIYPFWLYYRVTRYEMAQPS